MNSTDELVDHIVSNIGVPLPRYDYEFRGFISEVPKNISTKYGVRGVEDLDIHDSFRDACLRIIDWDE